jgi:two-component system, chemotaxis family, chemotaxis protein CheY
MAKTILVVDDSESMRSLLATTLRRAGYDTAEAFNGIDGLAQAKKNGPAAIVCDINMPAMNGLEMLEQLRADNFKTPVVMLTTEGQPALIQRARRAGAAGWMVKPFKPEALLATIQKLAGFP